MHRLYVRSLLVLAFALVSCSKNDAPTAPEQPPAAQTLAIELRTASPEAGKPVTFKAVVSNAVLKAPRFAWDFGDGVSFASAADTATHVYNSTGVYTITLRLTDSSAALDLRDTIAVTVGGENPVSLTLTVVTQNPLAYYPVRFKAEIAGNTPASPEFHWNFFNGKPEEVTGDAVIEHVFTAFGNYAIKISLFDKATSSVVATCLAHVQIEAPSVRIAIKPDTVSIAPGSDAHFTAAVIAGSVPGPQVFVWNMGNGQTQTLQEEGDSSTASATYNDAGDFRVIASLRSPYAPGIALAQDTAWVATRYATRLDSARGVNIVITGIFIYLKSTRDPFGKTSVSFDTARTFTVGFSKVLNQSILWLDGKPFVWNEDNSVDAHFEITNAKASGKYTLQASLTPTSQQITSILVDTYYALESHSRLYETTSASVQNIPLLTANFPRGATYEYRGKSIGTHISNISYSKSYFGAAGGYSYFTSLHAMWISDTSRVTVIF